MGDRERSTYTFAVKVCVAGWMDGRMDAASSEGPGDVQPEL